MLRKLCVFLTLCAVPALAETAEDYENNCLIGDQDACLRGTQLAQRDGQTSLMVRFVEQGCRLGNVISCSDKGMFHLMGVGGPVDEAKALPLIKQGCADGYSRACANLGWMYYTARGVPRSVPKAAEYYGRGCDGKSGAACANLAQMHMDGETSSTDGDVINKLLDRACSLGHQPAC